MENTYYNIYVCERGGSPIAQVGKNVSEHRLESRMLAILHQIDRDSYFLDDAEVGSEADELLQRELTNLKSINTPAYV